MADTLAQYPSSHFNTGEAEVEYTREAGLITGKWSGWALPAPAQRPPGRPAHKAGAICQNV